MQKIESQEVTEDGSVTSNSSGVIDAPSDVLSIIEKEHGIFLCMNEEDADFLSNLGFISKYPSMNDDGYFDIGDYKKISF